MVDEFSQQKCLINIYIRNDYNSRNPYVVTILNIWNLKRNSFPNMDAVT